MDFVPCKLVADKLFEAEADVVVLEAPVLKAVLLVVPVQKANALAALVQKAVLEAHYFEDNDCEQAKLHNAKHTIKQ